MLNSLLHLNFSCNTSKFVVSISLRLGIFNVINRNRRKHRIQTHFQASDRCNNMEEHIHRQTRQASIPMQMQQVRTPIKHTASTCNRKEPGSHIYRDINFPNRYFHSFSQVVQANSGIIIWNGPRPLPPNPSILIESDHSLIPLDATTTLLNNLSPNRSCIYKFNFLLKVTMSK
jgi:hypothetical protein